MKSVCIAAALATATGLFAPFACARGPSDYVYTPTVEEGEREIDLKAGTQSAHGNDERLSAASLGFGWGVNSRWFTELYGKAEREGSVTQFDAVEWENKLQLTETGRYPVDAGLLLEIERPRDRGEGYEFRYGLLLQSEWQQVQGNLNLLLERHYRTDAEQITEGGYQLQVKYRYRPEFEFGVQAIGWVGQWNDWLAANDQERKAGPAVFGRFRVAPGQAVRYNAAWLVSTTSATPANTFRMQMEYEF